MKRLLPTQWRETQRYNAIVNTYERMSLMLNVHNKHVSLAYLLIDVKAYVRCTLSTTHTTIIHAIAIQTI